MYIQDCSKWSGRSGLARLLQTWICHAHELLTHVDLSRKLGRSWKATHHCTNVIYKSLFLQYLQPFLFTQCLHSNETKNMTCCLLLANTFGRLWYHQAAIHTIKLLNQYLNVVIYFGLPRNTGEKRSLSNYFHAWRHCLHAICMWSL